MDLRLRRLLRPGFQRVLIIPSMAMSLMAAPACFSTDGSQALSGRSSSGPRIQSIDIHGSGTFQDGTPLSSTSVQFQLILDGSNLFQAGVNGCLPTPAHVAGTWIQSSSTDTQGTFSLNTPASALRAAVVRQCSIQQLSTGQVTGIILLASVLADSDSCAAYCSAAGDPSPGCVDDCSTGNRTLIARQATDSATLQRLLEGAASDGVIRWSSPLTFNTLGPALTEGSLPDLTVDGEAARTTAHVSQESFAADSCEVAESCVRAPGPRTVLRFDGTIQNLGDADLVIGRPEVSTLFSQSTCHNVPLLRNIMSYELIDPVTEQIVVVDGQSIVGRKQGFCMMDITQLNATAPQGNYDCDNQGITRGWADVYDNDLDCQFLDVTGVPPGNYTLKLTVNPDQLFTESDPDNNSVEVPVTIK